MQLDVAPSPKANVSSVYTQKHGVAGRLALVSHCKVFTGHDVLCGDEGFPVSRFLKLEVPGVCRNLGPVEKT